MTGKPPITPFMLWDQKVFFFGPSRTGGFGMFTKTPLEKGTLVVDYGNYPTSWETEEESSLYGQSLAIKAAVKGSYRVDPRLDSMPFYDEKVQHDKEMRKAVEEHLSTLKSPEEKRLFIRKLDQIMTFNIMLINEEREPTLCIPLNAKFLNHSCADPTLEIVQQCVVDRKTKKLMVMFKAKEKILDGEQLTWTYAPQVSPPELYQTLKRDFLFDCRCGSTPKCLEFREGDRVNITGLTKNTERNNTKGLVTGYDAGKGRFIVTIEKTDSNLLIKPANLFLI